MLFITRFVRFATVLLLVVVLTSGVVFADQGEEIEVEEGQCVGQECINPDIIVTSDKEEDVVEDPKCPSRAQIIKCSSKHLDLNQNGKLEREELQQAIDSLPWWGRSVLQILGSVNAIMKKCDVDGDDAISMDYDMEHNKDTCLATCFKRMAFKKAFFAECDL